MQFTLHQISTYLPTYLPNSETREDESKVTAVFSNFFSTFYINSEELRRIHFILVMTTVMILLSCQLDCLHIMKLWDVDLLFTSSMVFYVVGCDSVSGRFTSEIKKKEIQSARVDFKNL